MALVLTEKDNIFQFIVKKLQKHWEKKLVNLEKRVKVVADLEKWRPEVVDIWKQKKSNMKEYSVYFDGEFVCRCNSYTSPYQLEADFLKGILELYENNKIYFNEAQYKEETDLLKQITHDKKEDLKIKNQKVDKLNVDPLVKETLKELNKDDLEKTALPQSMVEITKLKHGTAKRR